MCLLPTLHDRSCQLRRPAPPLPLPQEEVKKACAEIASFPPLVFAGECRTLQSRLAKCATGEAFILQVRTSWDGRLLLLPHGPCGAQLLLA